MEPNNNPNNNIPNNNNPNNNIPNINPKDGINLDLSLGTGPQEQDPVEKQGKFMQLLTSVSHPPPNGQPSPPPPPDLMIPPVHYNNVINPSNVSEAALVPSPQPMVALPPSPSPYLAPGQLLPNVSEAALVPSPQPMVALPPSPSPYLAPGQLLPNVSEAALVPSPQSMVALPPSPSPYIAPGQLLQPPQEVQGASRALETPQPGTRLGRPPIGHRARRNSSGAAATAERNVDDKDIVPPYPWATKRPARIHNLEYLYSKNIDVISGQVHCRPCENTQTLEYNLREKFWELHRYIYDNKAQLRQRAPKLWSSPKLTPCGSCQNGMKPVIGENKEEINWLFLLLGQMLGCCTMDQLRYFCDKNNQHRTGAKDRVVYIAYLGLCKQLVTCDLFSL